MSCARAGGRQVRRAERHRSPGGHRLLEFLAIVMNATRTALPAGVAEPLERYPE